MDELTSKKIVLDHIRSIEGDTFQCDENAIEEAYTHIQDENKSSLPIKVLSIFGGFMAMLFFVGFLGISGLYDSGIAVLVFGIGSILAAIWLNRLYDKLIIDTFSISIYILGFVLIGIGLAEMRTDDNLIIITIGVIALLGLISIRNFILSFISILTVSGSLLSLILSNEQYDLIHLYVTVYTLLLAYLFLNEARIISSHKKLAQLYNPLRIGLIFSLLFGLVVIGKKGFIPISENHIWLSSIVMILVNLYLVNHILKINTVEATKSKAIVYTLSVLILTSIIFAPSISGAMIIILLSFLVHYKTGFAIGIIAMIYFVSQYYYDLNFTLLTKSILLFSSGIIFLALYVFTSKKLNADEKI